jgi:SAM-dependent methyltransferase
MTWMRPAPIRLLSSQRLAAEVAGAERVLDAGSGGRTLGPHVIAMDVVPRAGVDVVGDLCGRLPFDDGSFDLVVCSSVLEHVIDDGAALKELVRVTRSHGRIWIEVPFLYHFHVSSAGDTHDFRRWTLEGVKRLLPLCRLLETGHNVAPGTALRLIAAEVLALPFYSAKHSVPYHVMRWFWDWALLPLSALDTLCSRKAASHRATGGFWLLAEKS